MHLSLQSSQSPATQIEQEIELEILKSNMIITDAALLFQEKMQCYQN